MTIKDQIIYAMGENRESAVSVPQNQIITFHTRDCFNNQVTSEEYVMDSLDWDHINPATGPVYVEGAKAGDVLKVEILEIELEEEGTMCLPPGGRRAGAGRTAEQREKGAGAGWCLPV